MIITVGGIKGGTGKSTIAANLAVMRAAEGRDVLLVDTDEQRTATDFGNMRNEQDPGGERPRITQLRLSGPAVRTEGLRLKAKFEDIVIDTGGRDTTSQRAALAITDKLLVPVQPRSFDVWSVEETLKVAADMRLANPAMQVFCFLNRADVRGRDNEETASLLAANPASAVYLDAPLGNRKAFANAAGSGLAVTELRGADPKAVHEMTRLYELVFGSRDHSK